MSILRLKKNEDKRLTAGHLWAYSNEINNEVTSLKSFQPGEIVQVVAHNQTPLGTAYVNPRSLIAARLFSLGPSYVELDINLLVERIKEALALRETLFAKPYYRLIFGESDFLPGLVADRFGDHFTLQINTAGMDVRTDLIIEAFKKIFPGLQSILLRNDSSIRLQEGLSLDIKPGAGTPPSVITLEENGLTFTAPFWEGQKTGWFYDHRLNRARIRDYVADKTVLDVFSYLGAWGVSAAKWGARSVTCIDSSNLAVQFIKKNAALNQVAEKVQTQELDAFDALKNLNTARTMFDVIILDPPAFVKKQKDLAAGLKGYQRLNELALKVLKPHGTLITCSCSMHVAPEDFIHTIRRAALRTNTQLQLLERGHQSPDHPVHLSIPETDYLKALIVRKIK